MKYAVYDLSYQSVANSFLTFCVVVKSMCAAMEEECFLVFKKGPNEGFQEPNTSPYDNEEKKFRAAHMLYPYCTLMGMNYSTEMLPGIKESDVLQHGEIISIAALLKQYKESPLIFPKPSKKAEEIVKKQFPEAPVVISLRESYGTDRNSNVPEWLKFADYASKTNEVIIIRDIEKCNRPLNYEAEDGSTHPLNTFPIASIDLDIRLALFRHAKINFSHSAGNTDLLRWSDEIPYRCFKMLRTKFTGSGPKFKRVTQEDLENPEIQAEMKGERNVVLTPQDVTYLREKLEREGPQKVALPNTQGGFTKIIIGNPNDKRFKSANSLASLTEAGFPPGSQFPWADENQKIVWEDDTFENLKKEYDLWLKNYV